MMRTESTEQGHKETRELISQSETASLRIQKQDKKIK